MGAAPNQKVRAPGIVILCALLGVAVVGVTGWVLVSRTLSDGGGSAKATEVRLASLADEVKAGREEWKRSHDDLRGVVERSASQLIKGLEVAQATWVRDRDLNHVGLAGSACTSNSSDVAGLRVDKAGLVAPVVVVSYNRPGYLARTMVTLLRHWLADPTNAVKFPLFVSIDGGHQPTLLFATALKSAGHVQVIRNMRDPARCNVRDGYCNLGLHYAMLLQLFFECQKVPRLIFLEEDLEIAPDFFSYFTATAPLLDKDKSLLCVSCWNDHGQEGRAANHTALYRTDIMPGLGWMLNAEVALELLPGWQSAGWDEYTRNPKVRRERQCVFPEVARTHTFGKEGNSGGLFYNEHLATMRLNNQSIDWTQLDLSYLERDAYAATMAAWLAAATPLPAEAAAGLKDYCAVTQPPDADARDLVLSYKDNDDYIRIGRELYPMLGDISVGGGIPRASYHGTVMVRCRGRRLFLVKAK